MMFVRLALESDFDDIVDMALANLAETCPGERGDANCMRETLNRYLKTADPTFFVCEGANRQVVGFLQAHLYGYDYRPGLYTVQKVIYVRPENRGGRAAMLLMKHFLTWSKERGADRAEGGNDNDFRSETTASFLEHFGFERIGYAMRLNLEG